MIGGGRCDNNVSQNPSFFGLGRFCCDSEIGTWTVELGLGLDNFSLFIHLTIVGEEGRGD